MTLLHRAGFIPRAASRAFSGAVVAVASVLALVPKAGAQSLSLVNIGGGFSAPIFACSPRGEANRLFVLEKNSGRIRILQGGAILGTDFLNLGGSISTVSETGLLGMAFHPDYAANGRFFVYYCDLAGDSQLVEYHVSGNPNVALSTPVQTILSIPQPATHHNGGTIEFGPDGMLYFGLGDGGQSTNAQDPASLLGKMLRLDVDGAPGFIPSDNPYVSNANVRDEIWAFGLRNPWRFSFDSLTGDLYIGDVGESALEEIDVTPAGSGGGLNYGWDCMEGTQCTWSGNCSCTAGNLTAPIYEYGHAGGNCAVIGGYVYRGQSIAWLQGTYFFSDFCSGKIRSFRYLGGQLSEFQDRSAQLNSNCHQYSLAQDGVGEIYVVDPACNAIWRITGTCGADSFCELSPNSAGAGCRIDFSGSASVAANDMTLTASGGTPTQNGLFFYGPSVASAPFGDGVLCVAPGALGLHRLGPPAPFDASGNFSRALDLDAPPAGGGGLGTIQAGSSWYFQLWYRDPFGPGGTGFNLSNGLAVSYCP